MKFLILIMALFMTTTTFADLPSTEKPLVLILLGPPGAGKGTHAHPLSEKFNIPHISTGDLFREHLRHETPLAKRIKTFINEGKLVPDELVLDMVFSRTARDDCKKGYILDGFPRSMTQAKALQKRLSGKANVLVINFNITDSIIVERITGRISCKNCKALYHSKFSPPKKKDICDSCSGALYQRDDDKKDVIKSRLEVYHNQSAPLIDYYDIQNALYDINSEKTPREVFEEVMQTVEAALDSSIKNTSPVLAK